MPCHHTIVLFHPQIPQNTGNIVRTCSVTGTSLTLVRPLGFSTSDHYLKRAGLDYWNEVEITYINDLIEYLEKTDLPFYFFSSHATSDYTEITYEPNAMLIFGSETSGLPQEIHEKYPDRLVKIPMLEDKRCLNLATSVGIGLYEAIRQNRQTGGSHLHRADQQDDSLLSHL
ncbi:MAG: tRNA (cytidine(34)-2'-O)-methyltransferase [Simkaniaceae bacterium]|nr:tRNA (cytidine(34)-2'-O)-methyltransferase [Simkaniaceae bacterium]